MKASPSLTAFAQQHPLYTTGPKCSVCHLPQDVLEQVNAAPANGIRSTQTVRWLQSLGFEHMTRQRLENHYRMKHNARPHK